MKNSINLYKDILISVLYFSGVAGFMSGEILLSAALICTASLMGVVHFR
ncbi:MAG: hypothetical protein PHW13_02885 [Methylococcales bacterium]|nr:hypothetical protein [Methylococcales bacterium]